MSNDTGHETAGTSTSTDVALLLGFLNSRRVGSRSDRMTDAKSTVQYLRSLGLMAPGETLSAADFVRLLQLRDALATIVRHDDGADDHGGPASAAWSTIDQLSTRSAVAIRFTGMGATRIEPTSTRLLPRLLVAVHTVTLDGRLARVKRCAFEPCDAAFFDTTRSRTQRWHSYEMCGNRVNVAAHRAKAGGSPSRAAATTGPATPRG